jgi:hypothetical protein
MEKSLVRLHGLPLLSACESRLDALACWQRQTVFEN